MTYDILGDLYDTQKKINQLSDEIVELRSKEADLIKEIDERNIERTDNFELVKTVKLPNRSVNSSRLHAMYPQVYENVVDNIRKVLHDKYLDNVKNAGEKITIADVRKYLGDDDVNNVLERVGDAKTTYGVKMVR